MGKHTRTHTSLLTRQVATFLTMNTKVTSTLSQKEETFINLYVTILRTEDAVLETVEIGHEDVLVCFCKTF